jgi:hypothetical protein
MNEQIASFDPSVEDVDAPVTRLGTPKEWNPVFFERPTAVFLLTPPNNLHDCDPKRRSRLGDVPVEMTMAKAVFTKRTEGL